MLYVVSGFIFGFLIPAIARKFEKFMPATFAYALFRLFCINKTVSRAKRKNNPKYMALLKKHRLRSLVWAIISAATTYLAIFRFGTSNIIWIISFIWILLLLTEIDYRMYLLPDILTIPLLLIGLSYASLSGGWTFIGDSVLGAVTGYVLPVIASLFLVWKNKDVFGGGDIKLLTAVGAWVGQENILYTIILSTVLFAIYAALMRKRVGAFGPAITAAAIIVAFYSF